MRRGVLKSLARIGLPLTALVACGRVADTSDPTVVTHVEAKPGLPHDGQGANPSGGTHVDTVPLTVIDLGEVTAGEPVSFDIPPGALGFNVAVEGWGVVGVESLSSPSGELVATD